MKRLQFYATFSGFEEMDRCVSISNVFRNNYSMHHTKCFV